MTKEKTTKKEEKVLGFTVFIDRDRNELMKYVFQNALNFLRNDPVWLAGQELNGTPEENEEKMERARMTAMRDRPETVVHFDDFKRRTMKSREITKEVNKLIMMFSEQEYKLGWVEKKLEDNKQNNGR